ncbi:hypothetical protein A3G50_02080 [Candidatus Jorgensenbacteria bacterium RIFCSPLOWO2_12_FULL_42_11]|uniref:MgtC/SapB/SrpB/YhiD N-terminal domain-containing protein n=2 Tax=Parcubacteria group TaxID=1794811 RepID=A0A1F8ECW9_9BACT|nr:MAG: hypothetical protein A3G50_02080 [Candidatus Jorgensenbacteria bacterium RIFCSPLOWO2_12_FULL_42_11]OGM98704.1 MAG: hypothetical protein A2649_00770 [Candidatus Yanofskybacteria bacterium RIFCSPHIGHO2_01_FULL_41_26]
MNLIFNPQNLEIFGQLLLAVTLGSLIGMERELRGRLAGVKTHALVCLGAGLFTVLSTIGFGEFVSGTGLDPSRVASQIVVGIGFLGAGLIVFQQSQIQGLTTAAGIWTTAAIGMAIGVKFYFVALFATFLVLLVYAVLYYFEIFIDRFRDKTRKLD